MTPRKTLKKPGNNGGKWKGTDDPRREGFLLVAPEDMPPGYPKLSSLSVAGALFRVDPKEDKIVSMVTLMPDGVYVEWSACMVCKTHASKCKCHDGIMNPAGIEWIWIRSMIRKNNDEVPSGPISYDHPSVRKYGHFWYASKDVRRGSVKPDMPSPQRPQKRLTKPGSGTKAQKPSEGRTAPQKRLRKPSEPEVDVGSLNMAELDKEASKREESMLADVEKEMSAESNPRNRRRMAEEKQAAKKQQQRKSLKKQQPKRLRKPKED
jgi:hypothetical protein